MKVGMQAPKAAPKFGQKAAVQHKAAAKLYFNNTAVPKAGVHVNKHGDSFKKH